MTRSSAVENAAPNALHAEYYSQRASAGLIIMQGVSQSANGLGYARTPSIHTPAQVAAWRTVTDAVHANGGRIAIQLMHVGRIAHSANQPDGARILAPSPIAAKGEMWTDSEGMHFLPVNHRRLLPGGQKCPRRRLRWHRTPRRKRLLAQPVPSPSFAANR
jgi:N-ethylmaleimide reductase